MLPRPRPICVNAASPGPDSRAESDGTTDSSVGPTAIT